MTESSWRHPPSGDSRAESSKRSMCAETTPGRSTWLRSWRRLMRGQISRDFGGIMTRRFPAKLSLPTCLSPVWLALCLLVCACQSSRRNGMLLAAPTDTLTFAGFDREAGTTVNMQAHDQVARSAWTTIGTTQTSQTGTTDAVGTVWFGYSTDVHLPFGASSTQYWVDATSDPQQHSMKIETRS